MGLLGLMVVIAVAGLFIGPLGGSSAKVADLRMRFGHFTDEGHTGAVLYVDGGHTADGTPRLPSGAQAP